MLILLDPAHGHNPPQTAPSSNTPTPVTSPTKSSQAPRPKATTLNSSSPQPKTSPSKNASAAPMPSAQPKARQRPPHLHPHQRRPRRHPLAHCHRLVLLHLQRSHPLHLPLPIRPPHPLSRVLIENFFMHNKQDLAYLLSQEGRREIIETIIDGIERCVLTLVSS